METLADRIRGRRLELDLSPTDLANLCDVSLPAVLKWERGKTSNLKHEHLFLLADALNVRPRWLALGKDEKIASPAREAYRSALTHRDMAECPKAKKVWEQLAATFAKAAAIMVLAIPPFMLPKAEAATLHNSNVAQNLTIVHIVARLRRRVMEFFQFLTPCRTTG